MDYDYSIKSDHIDYGFINGNSNSNGNGNHKIVFIKTGLGGNYVGYENKYLIMAHQLRQKYGCSVIVASNPHDGQSHVSQDRQMIEQYIADKQIRFPELYFFGNSNGGTKGLQLADAGVAFRKMILVNMPLMINFHKTKRYISEIPQTKILAVYGEKDPSYSYIPFLDGRAENVTVMVVPKADHNFKGMLQEFIALSDLLMNEI